MYCEPPLTISLLEMALTFSFIQPLAGTENQEAEEEYNRTAQAGWVQRMFTSLFSESVLFNTREGRAGKVKTVSLYASLNSKTAL